MSLSVTELCHHDIPVTLLFAVNNADRWLPGAKGVAIPDNPETDIILSPRDSELGWGNARDTLPFEHSMQLEYEACIAETVVTALDAAAKLFSKRFLMHANAISNFRAALKEQSVQHVPPRSIEEWCQSTSVGVLTPAIINAILKHFTAVVHSYFSSHCSSLLLVLNFQMGLTPRSGARIPCLKMHLSHHLLARTSRGQLDHGN